MLESIPGGRLAWEVPGFWYTQRFEADLEASPMGSRLTLRRQIRSPLAWLFELCCARRWQLELAAKARRLAGGIGRC